MGFEPELATTLTEHGGLESVAMLAESTPVLVPGEERLIRLDRTSDRLRSELPQRHTAHVQYRDRRRNLSERFVLSFDLLEGARLPDKGLHDLVGEVAAIREHLVEREGV